MTAVADHYKLDVTGFRRVDTAEMYSFRFNQYGWALLVLDESTGMVAIHSDYGDWTYSWPSPGRGPQSLREFLLGFRNRDRDYLAMKFISGSGRSRRDAYEFDPEKTQTELKRMIIENRREGGYKQLDKEQARDLWNEIEYIENEHCLYNVSPELSKFLNGEPWEHRKQSLTPEYLWLTKGILPAILGKLAEETK